jgi:hypothetical protein
MAEGVENLAIAGGAGSFAALISIARTAATSLIVT